MCNCVELTNQALLEVGSNTELDIPMSINWATGELDTKKVLIATRKRNEKDRRKPSHIFASYCPFCGRNYVLPDLSSSPPPPPTERMMR